MFLLNDIWKANFEKKYGTSHWEIPSLLLHRNAIILQHLINQFLLYNLSSGLLRGVKNIKKINILALKVVVVAYKGWLLRRGSKYCDLTGKLLVFWKKGCWGEVVAYERWPQPEVQLSWCNYSLYFTNCFSLFLAQTMVHFTNSGNMLVDDLKLFLHGLPHDCQESTLKDFLEGTCSHKLLIKLLGASLPLNKMQEVLWGIRR